jgi:DNA-binding NtrC family response regulator
LSGPLCDLCELCGDTGSVLVTLVQSVSQTARILALTDDAGLIDRIETHIKEFAPIEISRTTDGLDLVSQYAFRHAKLVLIDASLISDRVNQLIALMRRLDAGCSILLFVPQDGISICTRALSLGRISYLVKPVSALSAASLICSALDLPFQVDWN